MLEDEEKGEGLDEEAEVALGFPDTAGERVWEEVLVLMGVVSVLGRVAILDVSVVLWGPEDFLILRPVLS